jgi:hypothetical protein
MTNRKAALLLAVGLCLASSAPARGEDAVIQDFHLKDYLGQEWNHDLVFFPLAKPLSPADQSDVTLLSPDDRAAPFQVSGVGKTARLAFHADLPAYGERTYRLVRRKANPEPSPLKVERGQSSIRVVNGMTGVEVPTSAGRYQDGPILGIRMKSGAWIGGSRLTTPRAIESYDVRVTAEGPVYVDLECRYRFAGGKTWALDLRVMAGEPVVLIRETFDLGDDSRWEFLANKNLAPTHAILLAGEDVSCSVVPLAFQDKSVQVQLCPWAVWWDRRDAMFFGLFRAPEGAVFTRDAKQEKLVRQPAPAAGEPDDMLIAAAGDVAAWARSGPDVWDNAPAKFVAVQAAQDGELAFQLQLAAPGRRWLLGTGSARDALVADSDVTPAQRLMNRFCETPLDTVKDMPLSWPSKAVYPRLVVKKKDVKRIVAAPDFEARLAKNPRTEAMKRVLLPMIAGTGGPTNRVMIDEIKRDIAGKLDAMVAYFRYGNNRRGGAMFGTMIPRLDIGYVLPPLDLALGAGIYTPEEKARALAQLAFVADKIASPDYCSPGRSLGGNPNMVTAWSAGLVLMACMMPDHPHAPAWYKEGMGRLDGMLDKWQGPNGAWLEAPHYQIAALDPIFIAKTAAVQSGLIDGKLDERVLRPILFLGKITTPPDPRFDNRRHYPPIGNTYLMESSSMFAQTARMYRDVNPEAANGLQWLWKQQGKLYRCGLGGDGISDFYVELLVDESIDPPAPAWGSEAFPGFGAVLRSGFPGDRETYMVYHQGDVATAHYDDDQGSFEMWGKGRPLSLDWGYHGYAPAWQHNRMGIGNAGKVLEFATLPAADYLHGQQAGGWDRQILFVKDADPLGPNYFVLRDSTTGTGTADWWLWVNSRTNVSGQALPPAVQINGDVVSAVGEHDVDLDVWFAPANPARLKGLEVTNLTVATVSGLLNGSWTSWTDGKTTQQGLHLVQPRGESLVTVLYPRLRDEAPAKFESLADGKVVKVSGPWGEDYAFLSLAPFEFQDGPVAFKGVAGVIRRRGDRVALTLTAAGEIGYGKARLAATAPECKADMAYR